MHHIKLFLALMVMSLSGFAQTYDVSICGTVNGLNGGTAGLDLSVSGDGQTTLTSTTTTPIGGYCFNFSVTADTGIYAYTSIAVTQPGCFFPVTISLGDLLISSDTAFTVDFQYCDDPNGGGCYNPAQVDSMAVCPAVYAPVCGCDGITYSNSCEAYNSGATSWTSGACGILQCSSTIFEQADSLGQVSLYVAISGGTAPYTFQWSTGETSQSIQPADTGQYCVTVTDNSGCNSSNCYHYGGNSGNCWVNLLTDTTGTTDYLIAQNAGTSPFIYRWYFNGNVLADTGYSVLMNVLGEYCVEVLDGGGCYAAACYDYNGSDTACYVEIYPTTMDSITYSLNAYAHGVAPYQYTWYYENVVIDSSSASVAVNANGQYCVVVTDSTGCTSSTCYYYGVNPYCSVVFSSYVAPTMPPGQQSTVVFSSYPSGVSPFTYQWYFSDGGTDTVPSPVHTYSQTGGWDWAYLEVTDATGCVAYYSDYVFLNDSNFTQPCTAGFDLYIDDISGIPGQTAFMDYSYSSGTIVSWAWDFGDGSTSTLQNPLHTYTAAGNYTICLTITDYSGCSSSSCWTYYIDPAWWLNNPGGGNGNACSAGFIAMQDSSMNGVVYLVDISYGSNLAYSWDLGNGTIVNDQYPYLTFNNEGWLYICLTVTDTVTGCSNAFCDSVGVDANGYLRDVSVNWSISVIPGAVTPVSTVGLDEEDASVFTATLYPNPASDILNLQVTAAHNDELGMEIVDITGKLIRSNVIVVSKGINMQRINVGDIAEGVYFIKLASEEMNETLRFVKTK